jgi:1,5-anhydro-D-fructose reductase (1,5-anhydro-D-mannitol-forming)
MKKTGWGFIGASNIAREYMIAAVRSQPGHEVVGIASRNLERARDFAAVHGIASAYDRVPDLLADPAVDVIYISSTNEQHCEQVLAAAAAGKHVLCEKPLALSVTDAQWMVDACRANGVVMATNHHLRNAATHRKVRELVQAGAVGTPLFARVFHAGYLRPVVQGWRISQPEAGGGAIFDIVVHDVDALRFILAAEPVEATALSQSAFLSKGAVEDGAMAILRFDNGLLAQIHAAFTIRHATTGLEIHGTEGSLFARDVMTPRAVGTIALRNGEGERIVPVEHLDLYAGGVARFGAAIRGDGSPAATGEDGVRSLAAAIAVLESSKTGSVRRISA